MNITLASTAFSPQKLPCLPTLASQIPYTRGPLRWIPSLVGAIPWIPIVFPACVFDTFAKKQVVTSVSAYFWVFYPIMFVCVAVSIINLTGPKITWKIGLWPCPWEIILIVLIKVGGDVHWGDALISLAGSLDHINGEQKLSSSMHWSHSVCWRWIQCHQLPQAPAVISSSSWQTAPWAVSYNQPFFP